MTTGTNQAETLSAYRCIGALEAWASSTSRMIWARAVSLPTLVARTLSEPVLVDRSADDLRARSPSRPVWIPR